MAAAPGRSVALTFDFDAMSLWIGTFKATNVSMVSRGEFAVPATRRILDLLDRHGVPATFFVPGHTALAYPDAVRDVVAAGHEVGHHGFVHERVTELSPDEEREVLLRGIEILEDVAGARPVGYRSPSWEWSAATLDLLSAEGFAYDSSLMGSDFVPYRPRQGDSFGPAEPYRFGTESSLVELPVSWALDDFPHFEYVPRALQQMKTPSQVHEIWWGEFDFFSREVEAGCYTLTMHPQVIGRGSRLAMLDRLVGEMRERGGVAFARLSEVAEAWRAPLGLAGSGAS